MATTRLKLRLIKEKTKEISLNKTIPTSSQFLESKKEVTREKFKFMRTFCDLKRNMRCILIQNIKLYSLRSVKIYSQFLLSLGKIISISKLNKWKFTTRNDFGHAIERQRLKILRTSKCISCLGCIPAKSLMRFYKICMKSLPNLTRVRMVQLRSPKSELLYTKFIKFHNKISNVELRDHISSNDENKETFRLYTKDFLRIVSKFKLIKHFDIKLERQKLPNSVLRFLKTLNNLETLRLNCDKFESKSEAFDTIKHLASEFFLKSVIIGDSVRKNGQDLKALFFELLNYTNLRIITSHYTLDRTHDLYSSAGRFFDPRDLLCACGDISEYLRDFYLGKISIQGQKIKCMSYLNFSKKADFSKLLFIWQENHLSELEFQSVIKKITHFYRLNELILYSKDVFSKESLESFFMSMSKIRVRELCLQVRLTKENVSAMKSIPFHSCNNIRLELAGAYTEITEAVLMNLGRENPQRTNNIKIYFKNGPNYLGQLHRVLLDEPKICAERVSFVFYGVEDGDHIAHMIKAFRKCYPRVKNALYFELSYKNLPKEIDLDIEGAVLYLDRIQSFHEYDPNTNGWGPNIPKKMIHDFEDDSKVAVIYKQIKNLKILKREKAALKRKSKVSMDSHIEDN